MRKELAGFGTFLDDSGQDWEIGVYRFEEAGRPRYETVVKSPEGQSFRPEEDFLGDFHLIDGEGVAHDTKLPMDMDALQAAVEKVESKAWSHAAAPAAQEPQSWRDRALQSKAEQDTTRGR